MSASQSTAGLSTAHQILLQKQKEYSGLQALKESSAAMLQQVEKLAEMSNIMADGGEDATSYDLTNTVAVGSVLRNWPHIFSILNMFAPPPPTDPNDPSLVDDEAQDPLPQLVRLEYSETPAQTHAQS